MTALIAAMGESDVCGIGIAIGRLPPMAAAASTPMAMSPGSMSSASLVPSLEPCEFSGDVRCLGSQPRLRVGTEGEVVAIGADGAFEIADLRGEATLFRR
jgi:hypothetical protein